MQEVFKKRGEELKEIGEVLKKMSMKEMEGL